MIKLHFSVSAVLFLLHVFLTASYSKAQRSYFPNDGILNPKTSGYQPNFESNTSDSMLIQRDKSQQSPINIDTKNAISKNWPKLRVVLPDWLIVQGTFVNTGKTVKITVTGETDQKPRLEGGPFLVDFIFEQMHFHWGSNAKEGSEHTLDGRSFSMEAHLVYYNSKYPSFDEARPKPDGLAVLTVFVDEDSHDSDLDPLCKILAYNRLPNLWFTHTEAVRSTFQWVLGAVYNHYYAYFGSLTTEPYHESTLFIVLPKPVTLSRKQISVFRRLFSTNTKLISKNWRALQPTNGRNIYRGKEVVKISSSN